METDTQNSEVRERVEQEAVILNGEGVFPKRLLIIEAGKTLEYRIVRTRKGKYQLNR